MTLPLNQILHGDCLEVMKGWPDGCVDMIWTDPPFGHSNMNGDLQAARVRDCVAGARVRDVEPIINDGPDEMRRVVDGMLRESVRILSPDCCCCCCCCCCGGGPKPTFAWTAQRMDSEGLSFFHAIVWDKSARGNGMGWRYRRNYEFVMVGHRRGGRLAWADPNRAVPNIVQFMPVRERQHPNEKPLALVKHFISLHTLPGGLVVDPFCGSGTTCLAAQQLGRRFIGIDISEDYCRIARERLKNDAPLFQSAGRHGTDARQARDGSVGGHEDTQCKHVDPSPALPGGGAGNLEGARRV